jgi:AcrR family transcriptional regulator
VTNALSRTIVLYSGVMPRISDERRAERRTAILQAGAQCFAKDGFRATSVDDVIAAAGTSAGGFYTYFANKDELVTEVAQTSVHRLTALVRQAAENPKNATLAAAMDEILRGLAVLSQSQGRLALMAWGETQCDPVIAAVGRREIAHVRTALRDLCRDARARGDLPPRANLDAYASLLLSLLTGFLVQTMISGEGNLPSYSKVVRTTLSSIATAT